MSTLKNTLLLGILVFAPIAVGSQVRSVYAQEAEQARVVMAIHGGAGTILPENMTDEEEKDYRAKLEEALQAGYEVLDAGGGSLDAVVAAITVMETSTLFNAGRGAVFTSEGTVEHDASIMEGRNHNAGAVAGVKQIEHPIELARLVMEESKHVMLAREGAETFAEEQGIQMVPNETFHTERRKEQLRRAQEQESSGGSSDARRSDAPRPEDALSRLHEKFGTVGAVALDREGNLAAGTSTGGMTNKRFGRIGDSPITGAGSYADNETCAVSSTGHGEYFIRGVLAHDIAAMMRYADYSVGEAARTAIMEKLPTIGDGGATGGVIALDRDGNVAMPFNTPGMYRGFVDEDGDVTTYIYEDEN